MLTQLVGVCVRVCVSPAAPLTTDSDLALDSDSDSHSHSLCNVS